MDSSPTQSKKKATRASYRDALKVNFDSSICSPLSQSPYSSTPKIGRLSQANECVVKDLDGKVVTGYKKQRFYQPKPKPAAVQDLKDDRTSR